MITKEIIGSNIRKEREKQKLTREQLCGMQDELTVKQLMRIELGKSLPTIVKLEYISDRLGVDISEFLGSKVIGLPEEYLEKKYKLIKLPSYTDSTRIREKIGLLEEIYEEFFEILPEEELVTLDLLEKTWNLIVYENDNMVEEIYEDYFNQLFVKRNYSLNDLLLARYFALKSQDSEYDKKGLDRIRLRIISQNIHGEELYNVLLLGVLSAIAGVYVVNADYRYMISIVKKMYEIIDITMQHTFKPGVLMLEAKYRIYFEKDYASGKKCYDLAMIFAQNLGDDVFIKNLEKERELDLSI